jgi:hypothetical protein
LTIRPRIVKVTPARDPKRSNVFLNAIPTILHVNSESRVEGMKHYELSSQYVKIKREVIQLGGYILKPPNSFYFNCENDVLYVSDEKFLPLLQKSEYNWCGILQKVQKLAFDNHTVSSTSPIRLYPRIPILWSQAIVPCWPALREVYVTCAEVLYPTSYNSEHLNQVVDFNDFKASLEEENVGELSWIDDKRAELQRNADILQARLKSVYARSAPKLEVPKVRSMVIVPDLPLIP